MHKSNLFTWKFNAQSSIHRCAKYKLTVTYMPKYWKDLEYNFELHFKLVYLYFTSKKVFVYFFFNLTTDNPFLNVCIKFNNWILKFFPNPIFYSWIFLTYSIILHLTSHVLSISCIVFCCFTFKMRN